MFTLDFDLSWARISGPLGDAGCNVSVKSAMIVIQVMCHAQN